MRSRIDILRVGEPMRSVKVNRRTARIALDEVRPPANVRATRPHIFGEEVLP